MLGIATFALEPLSSGLFSKGASNIFRQKVSLDSFSFSHLMLLIYSTFLYLYSPDFHSIILKSNHVLIIPSNCSLDFFFSCLFSMWLDDRWHPVVKHGRDYVNSVSCDQPSRWDEDGSEGITSFFTCSQQALPPQVPPRPPERSFHNYNNPPSAKPTFVAPSSSLTYGR